MPLPVPGLVIRYSYLWHSEHLAGREEGTKDRPCAIIAAPHPPPQNPAQIFWAIQAFLPRNWENAAVANARRLLRALKLARPRAQGRIDQDQVIDFPRFWFGKAGDNSMARAHRQNLPASVGLRSEHGRNICSRNVPQSRAALRTGWRAVLRSCR